MQYVSGRVAERWRHGAVLAREGLGFGCSRSGLLAVWVLLWLWGAMRYAWETRGPLVRLLTVDTHLFTNGPDTVGP